MAVNCFRSVQRIACVSSLKVQTLRNYSITGSTGGRPNQIQINRPVCATPSLATMGDKQLAQSEVSDFYNGKSVFITGGTGFIGKVLIEKLLRSCSGLQNIYVLVRNKKQKSKRERLAELVDSEIFNRVRDENPSSLNKLVAVQGELSKDNLGISEHILNTVSEKVSIVFHCAATIRFDEPLRDAIEINLRGTKNVYDLFKKCKEQTSFVHLSTAFSNCHLSEIQEKVYQPAVDPEFLLSASRHLSVDALDALVEHISEGRPNTYTLTKAVTEKLLENQASDDRNVTIVRPSIVMGSWSEPYEGWIDSLSGAAFMYYQVSQGHVPVIKASSNGQANLIPVDIVVNAMIVTAWHTPTKRRSNGVVVYNCCHGQFNPILWSEINDLMIRNIIKYPNMSCPGTPRITFTNNQLWNAVAPVFYNYFPAIIMDVVRTMQGKSPKFLKISTRLSGICRTLEYFPQHSWFYDTSNMKEISEKLSVTDRETPGPSL